MVAKAHGLFDGIASFGALLAAAQRAVRGKRERSDAATFFFRLEREVMRLADALQAGTWRPGPYREITVHEPKARHISIAPFADRVVHQAVHAVVAPVFERGYITDTFASLPGRGQHAAVRRFEQFRDRHAWVLRSDIHRFFPSIDHAVLQGDLRRRIACRRTLGLLAAIIDGSNPQEPVHHYFPGDDLFAPFQRRRGLPLGNLTSQLFGNLYLDPLDHHVKEVLRVRGYVRYLDDLAFFGDTPAALQAVQRDVQRFLDRRRLLLHPGKTSIVACDQPLQFLGFELLPGGQRRLPADHLGRAWTRLAQCRQAWRSGTMDDAEVRQRLGGWVAHARQADTWRLRCRMFPRGWFHPQGEPARPR
jgi:retron-type reverse transcriptase